MHGSIVQIIVTVPLSFILNGTLTLIFTKSFFNCIEYVHGVDFVGIPTSSSNPMSKPKHPGKSTFERIKGSAEGWISVQTTAELEGWSSWPVRP